MKQLLLLGLYFLGFLGNTESRRWRDTGTGSITFEEAWTIPELIFQIGCVYDFVTASERLTLSKQQHECAIRYLCDLFCLGDITNAHRGY